MRTREELERDAVEKHGEEADRICENCLLFIGWISILIFICHIMIFVIVTLISSQLGNKEGEQLVIIEEYLGSRSN